MLRHTVHFDGQHEDAAGINARLVIRLGDKIIETKYHTYPKGTNNRDEAAREWERATKRAAYLDTLIPAR